VLVVGLWAAFIWIALSALLVVSSVGRPREAISGGTAAVAVLIWAVILVVIASAAVQLA
jgi:MFS superfamily sulfate permease-like transporter